MRAENPPPLPPSPHHFSNGPSLCLTSIQISTFLHPGTIPTLCRLQAGPRGSSYRCAYIKPVPIQFLYFSTLQCHSDISAESTGRQSDRTLRYSGLADPSMVPQSDADVHKPPNQTGSGKNPAPTAEKAKRKTPSIGVPSSRLEKASRLCELERDLSSYAVLGYMRNR